MPDMRGKAKYPMGCGLTRATIERVREAPIEPLLDARGFRRERHRLACHAHPDQDPSATVHNNRLHCWVCERWWSNIDLVQELDGVNLATAVKSLADFYGIQVEEQQEFTPAERTARANERARNKLADAREARSWSLALIALADESLDQLGPCDPERLNLHGITAAYLNSPGPEFVLPRDNPPNPLIPSKYFDPPTPALLGQYRAWRDAHPLLTEAMVAAGREYDRRTQCLLARFVAEDLCR
jgi:hypothetical protein